MSDEVGSAVAAHLARIYPDQTPHERDRLASDLMQAVGVSASADPGIDRPRLPGADEIVLITYADTITEPGQTGLGALASFWRSHLAEVMSTVHVLPFFVSTSDGGFSIADYRTIAPELGSWDQLAAVVPGGHLMVDLVCNHGSAQSVWFDNFRAGAGEGHDFFLTVPATADVTAVVRPRTHDVRVPFETAAGTRHVWATFSADQVDFDFANPAVLVEFCSIIGFYLDRGATRIRLDAIAYLWKTLGTACIHLPQTHEVVKLFRTLIQQRDPNALVITETNVPHDRNVSYFGDGDEAHVVYNFTLAPLIVWSVLAESATEITDWLADLAPPPAGCTFLNFIASHDGLGVRPVEGLLDQHQLAQVIDKVEACGGSWSAFATPDGEQPYELNVSLADLLAGTDLAHADRYVVAHAIMLAVQGVPAFYVHSLLTSPADHAAVNASGHRRDINRSQICRADADRRLATGQSSMIFDRLTALIALRRLQPAFAPDAAQVVHRLDDRVIAIERHCDEQTMLALHNVCDEPVAVALPGSAVPPGDAPWFDLVSAAPVRPGELVLDPWQVAWLVYDG